MNPVLTAIEVWSILRLAYWNLDRGRYGEAEVLARGILAIDTRHVDAWAYFGEARRQQDDLDGARQAYGEALRYAPRRADIALRLAECLRLSGHHQEARTIAEKAREHTTDLGLQHRLIALTR